MATIREEFRSAGLDPGLNEDSSLGVDKAWATWWKSIRSHQESAVWRYSVAVVLVSIALGARLLLEPLVGPNLRFLFVALAILLAGRFGGLLPSLIAAALSVICAWYFFLDPEFSFALKGPQELLALAVFSSAAILVALLGCQFYDSMKTKTLSEERLRLATETAHVGIADLDLASGQIVYNEEGYRIMCRPAGSIRSISDALGLVHPDDRGRTNSLMAQLMDPAGDGRAHDEIRIVCPDGEIRWVAWNSQAVFRPTASGRLPVRSIGAFMDITDRKLAEDRLRALAGQLLTAQEEERSRIARELHDDVTQRLAVLGMRVDEARRDQDPANHDNRMRALHDDILNVTEHVRNLSHAYHSSDFEITGLPAALESHCREFSEHSGIPTQFSARDLPASIPREVSIVLYRTAQEALHNVLKHSGAKNATVLLAGVQTDDRNPSLSLTVIDDGKGFLIDDVRNGSGLGLLGIEERTRRVNGTLSISSIPGEGTRVQVVVPLPEDE